MPELPSYRDQSIDLQSKSTDWFLYEGNTDIQWVKQSLGMYDLLMYTRC